MAENMRITRGGDTNKQTREAEEELRRSARGDSSARSNDMTQENGQNSGAKTVDTIVKDLSAKAFAKQTGAFKRAYRELAEAADERVAHLYEVFDELNANKFGGVLPVPLIEAISMRSNLLSRYIPAATLGVPSGIAVNSRLYEQKENDEAAIDRVFTESVVRLWAHETTGKTLPGQEYFDKAAELGVSDLSDIAVPEAIAFRTTYTCKCTLFRCLDYEGGVGLDLTCNKCGEKMSSLSPEEYREWKQSQKEEAQASKDAAKKLERDAKEQEKEAKKAARDEARAEKAKAKAEGDAERKAKAAELKAEKDAAKKAEKDAAKEAPAPKVKKDALAGSKKAQRHEKAKAAATKGEPIGDKD